MTFDHLVRTYTAVKLGAIFSSIMATYIKFVGETTKNEASSADIHKKTVCNDLLSNILRGIVNGKPEDQIVEIIDDHYNAEEVFDARRILFKNFYSLFANDLNDSTEERHMGSKEKEIKKRWHLQDLMDKIHVIGKLDHDVEFCVPWNYRYVIMTEEEKHFRDIMREKDDKLDEKFTTLEMTIDKQNRATIMAVESYMKDSFENVRDVINEKKKEGSNEEFEDAEFFKGSAEAIVTKEGPSMRYIPRHIDVHILNSLILCCIFGFAVRFAQLFLGRFSINI